MSDNIAAIISKLMKNKLIFLLLPMLALLFYLSCVSCSSDSAEGEEQSGIKGWYVNKNDLASAGDFTEINKAIEQSEILSQYTYGGTVHKTIASRSLFIDDNGMYSDSKASFGRVRFSVNPIINVYRIIDDSTMMMYIGWLYELNATGARGKEMLYSFNAGHIFGTMAYYGDSPTYITYVKKDNKILTSEGEIFTVTSSGLVKDGTSIILSKYSPN